MRGQQESILPVNAFAMSAICPWLDMARAKESQILNAGQSTALLNANQALTEQALFCPHFGFASCAGRADVIDRCIDLSLVRLTRREAQ
ncbi:hypothetical protein A9K58_18160 [Stenotrophomonas maltophilia]|uniref:Uncharacterized protein n=1 Tax=Stenotrophomonas maltophilia TaxID=40324 RepID=A0A1A6XKQ9_STEMA|nr:hypothetical protein A9K58_18160 [Stenotrophomonas maltophilia]